MIGNANQIRKGSCTKITDTTCLHSRYEGDWQGGYFRLPGEATYPFRSDLIMASNHFLVYGVNPDTGASYNFGQYVGFDSLERYAAGANMVNAWTRMGEEFDVPHGQQLLYTVSHGETEHSVIMRTNEEGKNRVLMSLASMLPEAWDAPYRNWADFELDVLLV